MAARFLRQRMKVLVNFERDPVMMLYYSDMI